MNRIQLKAGWPGKLRVGYVALLAAAAFLLPARAQEQIINGVPGVATNKATINFKALAEWEVQFKARRGGATTERPKRVTPYQDLFANANNEEGGDRQTSMEANSGGVQSVQSVQSIGPSPALSTSFRALEDNNTAIPPDTMGAVGPDHIMTALNTQVRVQDRSGNILSTMDLNTFWAPLGADAFDPKVVYDPYEQRWIFTAVADRPFGFFSFSRILLAVSATSDPTGQWYLYGVFADINNGLFANLIGDAWADYPSIGFNKNWIVVSVNMFTTDLFQSFSGVQIYAFDKANAYTNGLGRHTLLHVPTDPFFGLVNGFTIVPAVTYDRYVEEMHLIEVDGFGNNFVNNRLRLSTISGDISREILRLGTSYTTNFVNWAPTDFGFNLEGFAPQLGSSNLIDNNDARIQNLVYRNGSLWCAHTVFLPAGIPDHTAIQWWQIEPTLTNAVTVQFGRIEETNRFFAFPSLAVNRCNDVMIGYSSFSANQYASGNYSFRFSSDPPGLMRAPGLLKGGEAPYYKTFFGFRNRWGDYSATVVDPVNDFDMWTIQEYAATPDLFDPFFPDRWGTWWGKIDVASLSQCGQLEFAQTTYTVSEADPTGVAVITVTNLTGAPGTVEYTTTDGSAVAGVDYLTSSGVLTFSAGQMFTNFTVTILDDGVLTSNRTVNLSLFNATGAATLGSLTNAQLMIMDDEFVPPPNIAGEFNFSSYFDTNIYFLSAFFGPSYFVTENESGGFGCGQVRTIILPHRPAMGALVTVTRTGGAVGRVLVDFQTALGGTAIPGQDYFPTNGTLVFDDYQTSTNFLVPVFNNFNFADGHKFVRLILSNPRPAPEEELERPGIIRPTLGPGAASQVVILEINQGFQSFVPTATNLLVTNLPAFAFERLNWRVDEYPGSATDVFGGVRRVNLEVILPFPHNGGSVRMRTSDPRANLILLNPHTQAGSDYAESLDGGPTPFAGQAVYSNPLFTDPALTTITNYSDYWSTNLVLSFASDECRQSVTMLITNDPLVEFNEDIVVFLDYIDGEDYAPNLWADQCTITILHHDQPAGSLDREWNPDNVAMPGSDPDFNLTPGANDVVYAVAVQPDGRTVVAGDFTSYNGWSRRRIARLNLDGGIDLTFNPGDGAENAITGLLLYPTNSPHFGKMLISGGFPSFNGFLHSGITRLLSDGQVDTTFNPGKGANGPIWNLTLQADGKILIVGNFSEFNDVPRNNIARLHADGALDLTFDSNPGPDFTVLSVATVPNPLGPEKILIGGDFFFVNNQPVFGIAQLMPDGSLDPSFNAGSGANGAVYSVLLQTNNLILVAGAFTEINDSRRMGVARLFPDGSLDPTFDPAYGANNTVYTMTLQPDGKVLIGGSFTEYNTTRRMALARLRHNGTLDTSFLDTAYNQFAGFTHPVSYLPPNYVNSIALQADGNIMVGGSFTNVGGNPAARHSLRAPHTVFTRADKRTRYNVARLLGGVTPGPGNAEFDADFYSVNENSGTVSIRMQRTDGRLGTLLGLGVTTDRFATPNVDYTHSTNANAWIERFWELPVPFTVGQVSPVYFKIPILDDLLEEGDELLNLDFLSAQGSMNLGGEILPLGGALGRSSATLDVIDNDFPKGEFNFLLSQYVTNEFGTNAISAMITVIRTNGSHGLATVDYFTRNSTNTPIATADVDYRRITRGQLRFGPGETTNYFLVDIINDDSVEFDENIELVLTNAFNAKLPGGLRTSIARSTLTIIDDDFQPGRLNFSSTTFTNSESEGYAEIRITRSGGSLGTVSAQYRLVSGTATAPADYGVVSGTLNWNSGDTTYRTIQVPLAADGLVEGPENFRVQLFDPRVGGTAELRLLGQRTNSVVTIADGDAYGTLGFNQPYFHADENAGVITVTVLRTAGVAGNVSVNFAALADSAVPGLDFTPVSGTVTLVPGQTSTTFTVPVLDDSDSDGNKIVRLQLSNPVNAVLGVPDTVNLTLVDNESTVNPPGENDRNFEQTPGANGPVYALSLYLTNGIFDGRVMIAGDFTNVNNITRQGLARLLPNSTLDSSFDPGEGPNGPVRAMLVQPDGKVVIAGNFSQVTGTNRSGIARLNLEGTLDRFFNPGAGADGPIYSMAMQPDEKIFIGGAFSRFNNEERPRLVRLNTNGVVDITFNAGTGPNGIIFAIALQPDGKVLIGGDFTDVAGLQRAGLARLNRNGSVDTSFDPGLGFNGTVRAIAVQPDGRIVVGGDFTRANGEIRNSLARLDASGALDLSFLAGLEAADNTVHALALQVDGKIVAAGDFTRFNGVTRNRITRLNPDGTNDPTINFGSGANSFISALAIQPDRKIVIGGGFTVFDDIPRRRFARLYGGSAAGPGVLEFSVQPFLADENATNALVVVRRRGGTTGAVSAEFRTFDLPPSVGAAVAGRDYVATNLTLSFPESEAINNIFIRIVDNFTPNVDRELGLQLSNFAGTTFGARPASSLLILNDEALVGFSVTNYIAGEGDPSRLATISVTRTLGTNTSFTVSYGMAGGTASPFFDYMPTNGTLVFNRGDITKNFQIPLIDDTLIEDTEYINLLLQSPSSRAFLGVDRATVSLLDNDFAAGQLLLASANYTVDEAGGYVDVTILRTNGRTGFITIDVATLDGTARASFDYVGTNSTIAFGDREIVKTFRVPILVDFINEPNETFAIALSRPTGGATLLPPSSTTVTINNNDRPYGTFVFSAANISIVEAPLQLAVNVYRVNGSVSNVTVNYATAPGTAGANVDYGNVSGTLVFPPGVTNQLIYIPIIDDALQEGSETFALALSSPTSGAGLGGPSAATVQIVDNDSPIIVPAGATLVGEANGNGVIDPSERVTLRLGLRNSGFVDTANLTATVQTTGGVGSPSPASHSYGVLTANGPGVVRDFAVTANVTNNGTLTVTLVLRDNGRDLGTATYTFRVGASVYTFYNPSVITIRDLTNAVPYPSTIQVGDVIGSISRISVVVSNITHDYPDDMDFLLVGPSGQHVMLMSDAGHNVPTRNLTLTYSDNAASAPPDFAQLVGGEFRPSNYGALTGADEFTAPAPIGPYTNVSLGTFNGQNPNGIWALYVFDDGGGQVGSIAGGWALTLNVSEVVNSAPTSLTALGIDANGAFRLRVRGQSGQRYAIQGSANMSTYSTIHSFIMPNGGTYDYQENAPAPVRFFRAVKNPAP